MPQTFEQIINECPNIQWEYFVQRQGVKVKDFLEWWNKLPAVEKAQAALEIKKKVLDSSNNNQSLWFIWAAALGLVEEIEKYLRDPTFDPCYEDMRQVELHSNDQMLKKTATALHAACWNGSADVVRLLLADPRIDVNKGNNEGITPLHVACLYRHANVIAQLLANPGVDVNKQNDAGLTPFFIACYKGYTDITAQLLADPRVDVNKADNQERQPAWVAYHKGYHEIVSLIEKKLKTSDHSSSEHSQVHMGSILQYYMHHIALLRSQMAAQMAEIAALREENAALKEQNTHLQREAALLMQPHAVPTHLHDAVLSLQLMSLPPRPQPSLPLSSTLTAQQGADQKEHKRQKVEEPTSSNSR